MMTRSDTTLGSASVINQKISYFYKQGWPIVTAMWYSLLFVQTQLSWAIKIICATQAGITPIRLKCKSTLEYLFFTSIFI